MTARLDRARPAARCRRCVARSCRSVSAAAIRWRCARRLPGSCSACSPSRCARGTRRGGAGRDRRRRARRVRRRSRSLTTVPLPPVAARACSRRRRRELYAEMLPGWPDERRLERWRPLAIDPVRRVDRARRGWRSASASSRCWSRYPWRGDDPARTRRALRARPARARRCVVGGTRARRASALVAAGRRQRLRAVDQRRADADGRASGPFVNPNHFAAWLEMVDPGRRSRTRSRSRRAPPPARRGRAGGPRHGRARAPGVGRGADRATSGALLLPLAGGDRGRARDGASRTSRPARAAGRAALLVGLGVVGRRACGAPRGARRGQRVRRWLPRRSAALLVRRERSALVALGARPTATTPRERPGRRRRRQPGEPPRGRGARHARSSRDYPARSAPGLGSWLHAFRPYQAPPVEGGIWDHAHNDYLELAAETGLARHRARRCVRRRRRARPARRARGATAHEPRRPHGGAPSARLRDRRVARRAPRPRDRSAGASRAASPRSSVHSLVDFGLRMPANLRLLMLLARRARADARRAGAARARCRRRLGRSPALRRGAPRRSR